MPTQSLNSGRRADRSRLPARRAHWAARALGAISGALLACGAHAADVRVVATINPVHSLVSGVMAGVGEPHLIIRGSVSPHSFSMRPSDAKALARADVVFLIGEALETSIAKAIDTLAGDARVIELATVDGMVRLPMREGDHFDVDTAHRHAADDAGHDEGSDDHDREGGATDIHVWLDPVNAKVMVQAIGAVLADADPRHAETYAANAATLVQRLTRLHDEVAAAVAGVRGVPFIVFHDGYLYFENRYGVVAAGSAVVSADRAPGVRRIHELRQKVRELGVTCVLTEPQFDPRLINVIVEGSDARIGTVDPLGANVDSGPELYFALLRNMAATFNDCLASG